MTDQITLTLPNDISERARAIAESTEISVEQVLIDFLKNLPFPIPVLPPDEQAELDALNHLSDDALWTIAREQMPDKIQEQAKELMQKNTQGTISDGESSVLSELVERADRLMLRKVEAAAILRQRGYSFSKSDFKPGDE